MSSKVDKIEDDECQIIPIIFYQITYPTTLWCRECGYKGQYLLPVSMPLYRVICKGCENEGHCAEFYS